MRVWVAGPHPAVEKLRLDLKTAGFVVAEDFACYLAILKPGAGFTIHGPKGRLTDLVAENVIDLRQTVTVGREGPDRSVTVVCGEKGDAEVASKAVLRAFEVLRQEMDAAPPPPTPKDRLFGIDMAWASKLVWLWLLLASPLYAQSGGFSMVQTYQDGTFQGPAFAINCSTNTTCTLSGGIFTITSQGGGGTPGGADTQVQFNDSTAFGGDAGLTFNKTTDTLTTGIVRASASPSPTITGPETDDGLAFASAGLVSLSVGAGTVEMILDETNDQFRFTYAGGSNAILGDGLGFAIATAADSDPATASACSYGGTSYVCEGTADAHETTVAVVDPTADATFQFPARTAGTYTIMATGSCTDGVAYLDASGVVQCANTELQYDGTILRADTIGLRDSSGSSTFGLVGGNHTANITDTVLAAATNTSHTLSGGHRNFAERTTIGTYLDENDANESMLLVRKTTGYVAIHGSGGASDQFTAIGTRNDREADGDGVSQSGIGILAYGSAIGGTLYGESRNDLSALLSEGPLSSGLVIGTGGQGATGPVIIGTEDANGEYPKAYFYEGAKALTDGAAVEFVEIGIPSNSVTGGTIDYFFYAVSVSGLQSVSGTLWFTAVNLAGTETCTVGNTAGVDLIGIAATSSGTLSGSFACVVGLTNVVRISLNANTSFASTAIFEIRWTGYKLAGFGTFTPL